jgi:hypothetical protein
MAHPVLWLVQKNLAAWEQDESCSHVAFAHKAKFCRFDFMFVG